MVRERADIEAFKAYTRSFSLADLERLEAEIYGSSDRATAVLLGSMVDSALEFFIGGQLRPTLNSNDRGNLFGERGPFGTFSAKILTAYAFNLFGPETRSDLDLIRTIRNAFAHSRRPFGFDAATDLCRRLQSPEWQTGPLPAQFTTKIPGLGPADPNNTRTRYMTACHVLTYGLVIGGNSGVRSRGASFDLR